MFYRFFSQQVRVGGRNKNKNKIKIHFIVFPSIYIQLENGPDEFYFYFTNKNDNISPGAVTGGHLINLAAVEKTKRKNIIEFQYCSGMSGREIQK